MENRPITYTEQVAVWKAEKPVILRAIDKIREIKANRQYGPNSRAAQILRSRELAAKNRAIPRPHSLSDEAAY